MTILNRRSLLLSAGAALLGGVVSTTHASELLAIQVYKSPWCGCCGAWVEHLQSHGFTTEVFDVEDLTPVKSHYGVSPKLQSCHTAVVNGYVIEGHVPAQDIKRLLEERPEATGLTVPGMPIGSPGMEQGDHQEAYAVLLFGENGISIFSQHP